MAKKMDRKRLFLIIVLVLSIFLSLLSLGIYLYKTKMPISQIGETENSAKNVFENLEPEKLKVIKANVTIEGKEGTKQIKENQEVEIKVGDRIKTDLNGIAALVYSGGTVVRIGPESTVVFTDKDTLSTEIGKVYVKFKKLLGVQESFEVDTDSMVAAVRGTAFSILLKPNTDPKLMVTDHEVEVTPKDPDGKLVSTQKKVVVKGEQLVVARLNRVSTVSPQKLTPEEKEWIEFNERSDNNNEISFYNDYSSLKFRTATPTPTTTPTGTPRPTSVPLTTVSSMPPAGYSKNSVTTPVGTFPIACYGASRFSVRMLTDSASDSDCKDNCPVLPLADYAIRNGGVAAINGMYFCPADYPSCAGKTNSFDTLFFNSRTKNYMNSANNVYSNIPFVGMNADRSLVFVGSSSEWGRDTSIIGGTAGNPRLTAGGNYAVNEGALDDKQRNVKSNRGAIVREGDMIYLCIIQGATVPDAGRVFNTLGADDAINIDGGGSSALWVNGSYKYGPGRSIPTAIILAP